MTIAAGIANKHYGSDNGLAHVLNSDTTDTCKQIICMVHGINLTAYIQHIHQTSFITYVPFLLLYNYTCTYTSAVAGYLIFKELYGLLLLPCY